MGLAIELGLMTLAAVATIAVGIYNSCNSSSKVSMPELNIADKFEAKKKNIETDLILELFKGIVTIQARIQAREAAKQELLNSIGSASGAMSASCISAAINVVQDNIAELQGENSQVNQTTAVKTQEGPYLETFPETKQQGSQIYDTPGGQIEGPLINIFPWVQPEPQVHVTPNDHVESETISGVPTDTAKELGDSILWTEGGKTYTNIDQLTKEQLKTKPPYSKEPSKWFEKGGTISIGENGIWTYHDWEGNSVSYPDGYHDFGLAGLVLQQVDIGPFKGYKDDFKEADSKAHNGPKSDTSTWHHHQDGHTLQEIARQLHRRFTHIGGMSLSK